MPRRVVARPARGDAARSEASFHVEADIVNGSQYTYDLELSPAEVLHCLMCLSPEAVRAGLKELDLDCPPERVGAAAAELSKYLADKCSQHLEVIHARAKTQR